MLGINGFIFVILYLADQFGIYFVDTGQSLEALKNELERHVQLLEEQRVQYKHLDEEQMAERLTFDQVCTTSIRHA